MCLYLNVIVARGIVADTYDGRKCGKLKGWYQNMRKIVYYLAGPMRGEEDLGRAHFNAVEAKLHTHENVEVINPAVLPTTWPNRAYMPVCLAMLNQADVVVMLKGWEDSQGAQVEREYAVMCEKLIINEEDIKESTRAEE